VKGRKKKHCDGRNWACVGGERYRSHGLQIIKKTIALSA
jgi:hypothetical protein